MILAAAQFRSKAGDVASNIDRHLQFADEANRHGADIIVFPELSLSGYEPTLAEGLETTADDTRFEPLKRQAGTHNDHLRRHAVNDERQA